uniref:RxLR effector protein n=1 Tax=Daphnia galeata TaxID=27404 RepID=A0A8J2RJ16_9CRUS|nr:unnamed protein product [Daphnia galeata]
MKSVNRIFLPSFVVVGLLFSQHVSCLIPRSTTTIKSVVVSAEKVATIDEGTEALVTNLRGLGADLKKSIDLKDQQLTNNLVSDIKGVWQRIIDKLKPDLYEDLIFYTARLLFLAKYATATASLRTRLSSNANAFPLAKRNTAQKIKLLSTDRTTKVFVAQKPVRNPIVKLDFNNYGGVVSLPRPLPKIG